MFSRKSFSALLTGASLAALSAASGRAVAGTTTINAPTFTWNVPLTDYLNISSTSVVGTFTNTGTISDGLANLDSSGAVAVHVRDGAEIDVFVNDGTIFASDNANPGTGNTTTADAIAIGLHISGTVPSTINNGSIGAVAFGFDSQVGNAGAFGEATGIYYESEGPGGSTVADLDNNGDIDARGGALAISTDGSANAEADAYGVYVGFDNLDASVSSAITNDLTVAAVADAQASGTSQVTARAWGDGISQDFENVDSGSAAVVNNGDVSFAGTAQATVGEGYASAWVNADAIDQEIDVDQASGLSAIVSATNSGSLTASGSATAVATYGGVLAEATAAGFEQDAYGGKTASSVSATNLGDVTVMASAQATLQSGTYAGAYGNAVGIAQYAAGGSTMPYGQSASAFADNQGSLSVTAMASTSGTYVGDSTEAPGAFAFAAGVRQQVYDASVLSATASNTGSIDVLASASADFVAGTYAAAGAFAAGFSQELDNDFDIGGTALSSVVNNGSVTVQSVAESNLDYVFYSISYAVAGGVEQSVYDTDSATVAFENGETGSVSVAASAHADSTIAISEGASLGVAQNVESERESSIANLTAANLGVMSIDAMSQADSTYAAIAVGLGVGIAQDALADRVTLDATNSGTLSVSAQSLANAVAGELDAPAFAFAYNTYVGGVVQQADAGALASLSAVNSGSLSVLSDAKATASTYAGSGSFGFGVLQEANATTASALFDNTGNVSVTSSGEALSDIIAFSYVGAVGASQDVRGSGMDDSASSAMAEIINGDTIFASADAAAGGLSAAESTYAFAVAFATGASQFLDEAAIGEASLTNSGTIAAVSSASATGNIAMAEASAIGYEAELEDLGAATAFLRNKSAGGIWAFAEATADGVDYTAANAEAVGVSVNGYYDLGSFDIDAVNKGLIAASAVATATGNGVAEGAEAYATGVSLDASDLLSGSFKNGSSGVIAANAMATSANGFARAVGIEAESDANGMLITNKGLIAAYAEGGVATATGILIDGGMVPVITTIGPPPAPAPMAVATIENHGDIWAGISTDGGKTILRGNAINTQDAPNAVTILLENNDPANIFGNIDISADDQIKVQNGVTKFDGVINPDMVLEGGLLVGSNGKLVMLNDNDVEGPSKAYVDVFEMGKKGTLQFNLTPDNSDGAYPTITANNASLGGTFKAHYANGLYANKLVYENVITADSRSGHFAKVVDNSILLKTKAIYDDDNNVDLKLTRTGFGDVPGLTQNQKAAGSGIEKVYDDLPNKGPFSGIVKDLFTLDAAEYAAALDQLAGAEYAQLMQSVLGSTGQLNASITDRMDCSVETNLQSQGADARKGCFDPNKVQMWARVGGAWNNADGDKEAPGYDETQTSIYIGGDYAINTNVFIGAVGGYFNSSMDFDDWGGRNGAAMNYDGGQIALYGGYDDGTWYGRNILSYGFYSGDSRRSFGITSAPQALTGDFNTDVVSYYGEAGRRFQLMDNVGATPFLGLGLASAGIDSFTEKDPNGTGAALKIRGADSSSVATTLGFRVNGHWGGFRPEATLAWQHQFADARQTVDMSFADAPNGANFSVVSSDPGSDALIVGLGGSYSVSRSSVITMRYDGTFWSGFNSQQLTARWTTKF